MNKLFLFTAGAVLLSACSGSGSEEVTEPVVTNYTLNVDASSLAWVGHKKGAEEGMHSGTVKVTAGTVEVTDGILTSGAFTIDARSIATTDDMGEMADYLNADLKSENFFDVEKYPTFEVTLGELVDGNLPTTIKVKGVDFSQEIPVTVNIEEDKLTIHGDFTFDFEGITGVGFEEHDGKRITPQVDFKLHFELTKVAEEVAVN